MVAPASHPMTLWPLAVYCGSSIFIVTVMIALSYVLGQRHRDRVTGEPYESGIVSTGSAQVRMDVKFYLVAMFFVIFDLESIFIFPWALNVRELGWPGYISVIIFVAMLFIILVYLWRLKALQWGPANTNVYKIDKKGWPE
ncbi:MAG: NADH-quinone oxidoreductase subunit A [Dissulfurispiraceae bacterium]